MVWATACQQDNSAGQDHHTGRNPDREAKPWPSRFVRPDDERIDRCHQDMKGGWFRGEARARIRRRLLKNIGMLPVRAWETGGDTHRAESTGKICKGGGTRAALTIADCIVVCKSPGRLAGLLRVDVGGYDTGGRNTMQKIALSEAALPLLRNCLETRRVAVTDGNRETYRELACAGIMYPVSGFVSGPEANYRFTDAGWERRFEWLENA